jgi:hypothetical protein
MMQGSVADVSTGGAGVLPTGWSGASNGVGITRTGSKVTDDYGTDYVKIVVSGTPSADADCNLLAQVSPALLASAVNKTFEGVVDWRADSLTGVGALFTRLYSGTTIFGIDGHYSGEVGYCRSGLSIGPTLDRTPPMYVDTATATFGFTMRVRSGVPVDATVYAVCSDLRPTS